MEQQANAGNEQQFHTVVLAGLLHDIGKFMQRGVHTTGKHPEFSRDFITKYEDFFAGICDTRLLAMLVEKHHEDTRFPRHLQVKYADETIRDFALLVSRADNYSSAERDETRLEKRRHYTRTPLTSVFSRLQLGTAKPVTHFYPLQRLTVEQAFPMADGNLVSKTAYGKYLDEFEAEFGNCIEKYKNEDFNTCFAGLMTVLQNYTWCIPSSTWDGKPDVSLYDHVKTTAAIAAALYRYHQHTPVNVTEYDEQEKFFLVAGDLSGIQSYIFRLTNKGQGGIAKRLRARSFYLSIVADTVSHMLLNDFGLPLCNLLMSAGGNFYVLLPNVPGIAEKIDSIRCKLDTYLLTGYQGELSLHLAGIPLSGKQFDDFSAVFAEVRRQLQQMKTAAFRGILCKGNGWYSERFVHRLSSGLTACADCNKIHLKGVRCEDCEKDLAIGRVLPGARRISFFNKASGEQAQGAVTILGSDYSITIDKDVVTRGCKPYLAYNLGEKCCLSTSPELIKFMAKYVPRHAGEEYPMSFDDIVKQANGYPLLACMKADVDHLGLLFRHGFDDGERDYGSISRVTTMSRMLELFFSGWLEEALTARYPSCYTVYSGGDDLLLVGPWDKVADLAGDIQRSFKKFTANHPDITISAGMSLFKPKYPIDTVVGWADTLLDRAKEARNQIAAFGQAMSWAEYETVLWEGKKLAKWLRDGAISSGMVYRLRQYAQMYEQARQGKSEGWMFVSMLQYDISRNSGKMAREVIDWLNKLSEDDCKLMEILNPVTVYALYSNRGGENRG